jgi:hypothetical protein
VGTAPAGVSAMAVPPDTTAHELQQVEIELEETV